MSVVKSIALAIRNFCFWPCPTEEERLMVAIDLLADQEERLMSALDRLANREAVLRGHVARIRLQQGEILTELGDLVAIRELENFVGVLRRRRGEIARVQDVLRKEIAVLKSRARSLEQEL